MGASKGDEKNATKLLKLQPYKTTAINSLQPSDSVATSVFCNLYLWSVGIFKTQSP
jgi:hypothetical protein